MSLLNIPTPSTSISAPSSFTAQLKGLCAGITLPDTTNQLLTVWDRYACTQIMEHVSIGGEGAHLGKVMLTIPAEKFFTQTAGHFLIRLAFPEINSDGDLTVKVGLSYKVVGTDAVLFTPGDNEKSQTAWVNVNSNPYSLDDLVNAGYLAPEGIDRVFKWALANVGQNKNLSLVPTGDVVMVLRHTIRPLEDKKALTTTIAPGGVAGVGIDAIGFSGASLLPATSGLLNVPGAKPRRSFAELQAAYGGNRAFVGAQASPTELPEF